MSKFGKLEDKAKRIIERAFGGQKDQLWGICKDTMTTIEALTKDTKVGGDMLNQRQCFHLSQKLSEITLNIGGLLSQCKESKLSYFKPALSKFVHYLEKTKVLVENCGQKNWLGAAIFQSQNENAFREILFDVGLCYNAIYEQARSWSEDWDVQLKDLRSDSSMFLLGDDDIHDDELDLQKKLKAFVHEPTRVIMLDPSLSLETCKCLASFLLVKMQFSSQQSHGNAIDASSPLLWQKETEPKDTWGESKYLGSGANEGGVCSTKWLGTPCAKKEFHLKEYENILLKEAGIMAYLKHPRIINFICCGNGQAKGDRFIAMELMEKSLFDLIEDKKDMSFSLSMVVDIIMQIARGMWYLHDQGIAHRDLKPQNVVLNLLIYPHLQEDHVCLKLVDFGTSKTKVEASKSNIMTYCGVGTTIYRAPEVHPEAHPKAKKGFFGKVNWFQADMFSFAMTCAHIITLKKPFQEICSPRELYNAVMNGTRPNLLEGYPEELLALIRDCWNTIPRKRPSFMKVCERLEILRHKIWRGCFLPNQSLAANQINLEMGLDFCKTMIDKQSSLQRGFINGINQALQVDDDSNDDKIDGVAILPCLCGCTLQLLNEIPLEYGYAWCDVCQGDIYGDIYHCGTCQFDAHQKCVEIEDKVKVFFHHHPLYLLIQHYYNNNLDAICHLCEESVQQSEWVYRCEECDFDIHALCSKYPEVLPVGIHRHPLTMIQCHPQKNVLSIQCCNGEIRGQSWHYKCMQKSCAFHVHPVCSSIPWTPLCIFDHSHRLSLMIDQRLFHCGRCGSLGYSWFYRCEQCKVELHLDCNLDKEKEDENGAYEKFIIEYGMTTNDHTKMEMISKLMDMIPGLTPSKASSSSTSLLSSSSSSQAMMKMQSSILRPTEIEKTILGGIVTENLRKEIVDNDQKRKAEKMAIVKEARQKSKVNLLEIYENLKKNIEDLQSLKTLSNIDQDTLSMRLKMLKERCCTLRYEVNPLQGQMSQHGPHIVLFFDFDNSHRLLVHLRTSLPSQSGETCFIFLCEEPGHEHIVNVASCLGFHEMDVEIHHKLQPLLRVGLQIVTKAIKTLPIEPSTLEVVTLPSLGKWEFNVHPIELETYNLENMRAFKDKEDVEALKIAEESAAELFSSILEDTGVDIFRSFGLQRVRYIMSDESKVPCYTRGLEAWLCDDHMKSGLEAGTLEPYPSKFYNRVYDIVGDK